MNIKVMKLEKIVMVDIRFFVMVRQRDLSQWKRVIVKNG
jgi:hypothetical protein